MQIGDDNNISLMLYYTHLIGCTKVLKLLVECRMVQI